MAVPVTVTLADGYCCLQITQLQDVENIQEEANSVKKKVRASVLHVLFPRAFCILRYLILCISYLSRGRLATSVSIYDTQYPYVSRYEWKQAFFLNLNCL
jgi:hypothetical protein